MTEALPRFQGDVIPAGDRRTLVMGAGIGHRLSVAGDRKERFFHPLGRGEPFEDAHRVLVRVRNGHRDQHIFPGTKFALRHTQADGGTVLRGGAHSRGEEQSGEQDEHERVKSNLAFVHGILLS